MSNGGSLSRCRHPTRALCAIRRRPAAGRRRRATSRTPAVGGACCPQSSPRARVSRSPSVITQWDPDARARRAARKGSSRAGSHESQTLDRHDRRPSRPPMPRTAARPPVTGLHRQGQEEDRHPYESASAGRALDPSRTSRRGSGSGRQPSTAGGSGGQESRCRQMGHTQLGSEGQASPHTPVGLRTGRAGGSPELRRARQNTDRQNSRWSSVFCHRLCWPPGALGSGTG